MPIEHPVFGTVLSFIFLFLVLSLCFYTFFIERTHISKNIIDFVFCESHQPPILKEKFMFKTGTVTLNGQKLAKEICVGDLPNDTFYVYVDNDENKRRNVNNKLAYKSKTGRVTLLPGDALENPLPDLLVKIVNMEINFTEVEQ